MNVYDEMVIRWKEEAREDPLSWSAIADLLGRLDPVDLERECVSCSALTSSIVNGTPLCADCDTAENRIVIDIFTEGVAPTMNTATKHIIEVEALTGDNALHTWDIPSLRENLAIYQRQLTDALNYGDMYNAAHAAFRVAQINEELESRNFNGYRFAIRTA